MNWLMKKPQSKAPLSKPEPSPSGNRFELSAVCSKTGTSLLFLTTLENGRLFIDDLVKAKSSFLWKGSTASAPPVNLPAPEIRPGTENPVCPSCRIRIRRGSWMFECGSCKSLNCMGSHLVKGSDISVKCGCCEVRNVLAGTMKAVSGSLGTNPTAKSLATGRTQSLPQTAAQAPIMPPTKRLR